MANKINFSVFLKYIYNTLGGIILAISILFLLLILFISSWEIQYFFLIKQKIEKKVFYFIMDIKNIEYIEFRGKYLRYPYIDFSEIEYNEFKENILKNQKFKISYNSFEYSIVRLLFCYNENKKYEITLIADKDQYSNDIYQIFRAFYFFGDYNFYQFKFLKP